MDGGTSRRLVLLGVVIVGAVVGAALLTSRSVPPTAEPSASPAPTTAAPATPAAAGSAAATGTASAPATAEATGVVVAVETGDGLGDVRGFTLRIAGGELLVFDLRELQNADEFAPGHLVQHQADAFPVRVAYRTEGPELLALRLEDAPP